jgi:hypothetical protein
VHGGWQRHGKDAKKRANKEDHRKYEKISHLIHSLASSAAACCPRTLFVISCQSRKQGRGGAPTWRF